MTVENRLGAWLDRRAWLPVPALLLAMLVLRLVDPAGSYDSPRLMMALNVVFATSVSLLIAYLVARNFVIRSSAGLLMLGCGAIAWGAGGVVAAAAGQRDVNVVVTIHNLSAWLAGACHLAGVALTLRRRRSSLRVAIPWLPIAYAGAASAVALVTLAAVEGATPAFFVQGQGGTPLRQLVLGSAAAMFALAALLLRATTRGRLSGFRRWYSLALGLVALGLFGVLIQRSHGNALGWVGRTAQYLSGVYMLVAAIASVREARAWGIPLEAALQESESRYEALFASSLDAILVTAADGQIIAANAAACSLFGTPAEELRGSSLGALVDPGLAAGDEQGPAARARAELRFMRKDGSRFDGERSTIRIDAAGRAFEIIRDLTERRRAEEAVREVERASALRAGEAKFRVLIERSADMVLVLDEARAIRFWSPSATTALGRAEDHVLGRSALDLVHPEDEPELSRALGAVLSGPGATSRVTARLRHEDGSYRLVEAHARNLLHDPAVCGIVLNARDVTEQRRLEEQYRQAQKLESIGRLAGGVAHDFNNLLTVILGTAEVLKEDRAAGAPCDPEDIDQIRVAGERARDLTHQLLAFARKQVIAPAPLDLNAVVRGHEKLMRRVLGEDVELAVLADPALWPVVCDPAQLGQVLLNLAVNARDSMPLGGRLGIETRNAVLGAIDAARRPGVPPGEWVRLTVRDSGTGMSPEAKAHLFEPFFTTKEKGRGTGLGLATVHGIVAQSGGHIRVESSPGEGTAFDIFFPRSREAPAAAPEPARARTSSGTETVFVVEDDPLVREVTVRSLRSSGYRVLPAGSGREAFDLAARERDPVHLLVTDVVMPELDGRAVADRLRRQYPDLRVLFVSGYTHDVIGRHGVLDAGVEFLPKPFTASSLLARVRALLDA